jgi:anti-sigma factor RsiW
VTTCEAVRERLPEHVLGTLDEVGDADVRRHLRGCAACRREMTALGEGVATFARAAHDTEPPAELRERVLGALSEEWTDAGRDPAPHQGLRRPRETWVRVAAVAAAAALVVALAWGTAEHRRVGELASSGDSYTRLLTTLGGKEFRAGALRPAPGVTAEGSVVVYDSHVDQSWVAVFVRGPGLSGRATATLSAPDGRTVDLWNLRFQRDGDGSAWLVTAMNLEDFDHLVVTAADGSPIGNATITRV